MPAEPMPIEQPPHRMSQLTTFELQDYRRQLERALNDRTIGNAPIAASLRAKLDEVLAEQESRTRAQTATSTWPIKN
jgi:hypothetical protein